VRQAGSTKVPELKLGAVDSFAATAGPSLIRALLATTTRISFRSGLAHDHSQALLARSLDLIVTSGAMDDIDGLERYPLLTEPFMLLIPNGIRVGSPVDLKELAARHSLIRFSARSQMGAQIERHLRRLGLRAPRMLEVDTTDTLIAMVQERLGWGIATPLCLLQVRSKLEKVALHPFPGAAFVRQLHLICRAGEYGELPQRVATLACDILRRESAPEMRRIVPWLRNQLIIG
jgi:DNA-binding transcriptional LysR family regulator